MERPFLGDEVQVRYRRTETIDDAERFAAMALLSEEEQTRRERFRTSNDRDEYAIAHALLRRTLSEFGDRPPGDWRFAPGPHGKPALTGARTPLSFNLSHTRGLVACAVAAGADVGLDVEQVTRVTDWRRVASRYFSRAELAEIDRAAEPARQAIRFFEIWTLKEAFVKAVGIGLSQPLNVMTFSAERPDAIAFTPPAGVAADAWRFALCAPAPEYRLAVAVSDGSARPWRITVRDDLHWMPQSTSRSF